MQIISVSSTGDVVEEKEPNEFLEKKGNFLWIDISDPEQKDIDFLEKHFKLHPLTLDEIIMPNSVPKVDEFDTYTFIIFHRVNFLEKSDQFKMEELNICIGKNYLITAHNGKSATIQSVTEKLRKNIGILKRGPDFLLYEILRTIVEKYFKILELWDAQIDNFEDRILIGRTEGSVAQFIKLKKDLNRLKRILAPQRELVNKLARKDYVQISDKAAIYFRDLYDSLFRQQTILEEYRDLVTGIFEAYLSITSNRLNQIMKELTIIATIFLPLTFVVGVYGMNFKYMPELDIKEAYFVLWGVMILIAGGMVYYFKNKKWV